MSLFSKLSKNNDKALYPWSQKKLGGSSSALPRAGHAATPVSPDAFIIYGGIHRHSTKKELFSIDANNLSANNINTSGDVPSPRISPVLVAINGHILLYGGKPIGPDDNYDSGFYLLNLHSKQWTRIQMEGNHPIERSGHSAVAHEGIMYIWGGQKEGNYFNDLFVFNSSTFQTTPRWEQLGYNNEGPEPRSGHISAIFENKLYIFGGTDGHHLFNDIWSFDLHNGLWTRIEAEGYTPASREGCASAMVDDVIYIIGGKGENGVELNDLCAYKIMSRRWFRFQNMGPSPSPRHGLTMTAVREKLYVLGGENDTSKLDDSSFIFILDSTKIKYPTDTPQQQQSIDNSSSTSNNQQQQQQSYNDTSSIDEIQQQQFHQQYQQGGPVPPQQQQQYNQGQKYLADQRQQQQQQRSNQPTPPQQQGGQRNMNKNGFNKEIDTSVNNFPDSQPSPTSSSSPSSLSSPRHRSYYPTTENQQNQQQSLNQPPVRPPRHMSTVPEAALRRPRATSPLPQQPDAELTTDIRRQYQGPSPTSPIENELLRGSPMQASILSITEDNYLEPPRMMSPQQNSSNRSSPSNNMTAAAPPPRPPREGVGLNAQRNTMVNPDMNRVMLDHDEPSPQLRPKSQMPPRNQSHHTNGPPQPIVPHPELAAVQSPVQQHQQLQPQQQQMEQQQMQMQQQQAQQAQLQAQAHAQAQAEAQAYAQQQAQLQAEAQAYAQQQAQLQAEARAQAEAQAYAQQQAQLQAKAQTQAQAEAQAYAQQQAQLQAQAQAKAQAEAQAYAQAEAQAYAQQQAHAQQQAQQQQAQRLAQEQQLLQQQQAQRLAQEQQLLQQQQLQQQQMQQQYHAEAIPERSPSRQLAQQQPSSPSPVSGRSKQQENAAAAVSAATAAANAAAAEERQSLLREIKARDVIISEMKKKEHWWRTEVSLARKQKSNKGESFDEGPDADEALLMDIDHLEEDKVKLFEQLVSVKSELRRVRASILQQAQPMSEKVAQADRMRTAALQEAAYFKSKYLALKARRQEDLEHIEVSRCDELEKRLAAALTENEASSKTLQQLQKRSQHDQQARVATEERAREAHERAEEAQQAHQRALEELQVVYTRATKAEVQVRDNAVKIADLTQQLSEALMAQPAIKSQEVAEAQLKASQLEAANLKARNETAALKQKVAENMDDIARLRTLLSEREDALTEAKIHVEDCEIQLGMMREAMNSQQQQHQKGAASSVNGFAPTRAY